MIIVFRRKLNSVDLKIDENYRVYKNHHLNSRVWLQTEQRSEPIDNQAIRCEM